MQTLPSLFLSLARHIERERGFEEVKFSLGTPNINIEFKTNDLVVSGDEGSADEDSRYKQVSSQIPLWFYLLQFKLHTSTFHDTKLQSCLS